MNLRDMIDKLSYSQVERFARSTIWSHMDLEEWLKDSPLALEGVHAAWSKLSGQKRKVLATIVSRFGASPFLEEQLLQEADRGMTGSTYRLGLLTLAEAGIVFIVRKGWGERLYFLPRDMYFHWHRIIFERHTGVKPLAETAAVWSDRVTPPMLSLQLLHTLAELQRSGMKWTAKRLLTKRTIDRSSAHIAIKPCAALELIFGSPSSPPLISYPLPLAIMLDLAMRCHLLAAAPAAFFIQEERLAEWLCMTMEEQEKRLLRLVMEQYAVRCTGCAHAAARLSGLPILQWFEIEDASAQHWCEWMADMGWMELAWREGNQVFRWLITPWPYERRRADASDALNNNQRIAIAADGNIYVPPYASAALRWQMEMIAEREQTESIAVYRMNVRSLKHAAEMGYTRPQIAELLEHASGERLPDLVYADLFSSMKNDALEMPRILKLASDGAEHRLSALLHDPNSCHLYEPIVDFPTGKSLFQGLEETPSNWLNQYRNYHHTTRRELLERALSWRISVKLQCGEDAVSFVPERIETASEGWAVVGYTEKTGDILHMRLEPAMWQEMMLEFPHPH